MLNLKLIESISKILERSKYHLHQHPIRGNFSAVEHVVMNMSSWTLSIDLSTDKNNSTDYDEFTDALDKISVKHNLTEGFEKLDATKNITINEKLLLKLVSENLSFDGSFMFSGRGV